MAISAAYLLAIRDTPGAGIVAASRLAEHFKTPDDLANCPREQVILRLKHIPNAETLAARLQQEIHARYDDRERQLLELGSRGVEVVSSLDEAWPPRLRSLDRSVRPLVLFCYGGLQSLSMQCCAFLATPPLEDDAFELAQAALRRVGTASAAAVIGASSGFDVVAGKIGSSPEFRCPVIMVASAGLRKITSTVRPTATAVVRSGGLLLSPFEMDHGPFSYDEHTRALIQTAMSHVSVFVTPRDGTAAHRAMNWSIENGRATFQIGGSDLSSAAHCLTGENDLDWLTVALENSIATAGTSGDRQQGSGEPASKSETANADLR